MLVSLGGCILHRRRRNELDGMNFFNPILFTPRVGKFQLLFEQKFQHMRTSRNYLLYPHIILMLGVLLEFYVPKEVSRG